MQVAASSSESAENRDIISDSLSSIRSKNIKLTIEFDFNYFKYTTERFNTDLVDNRLTRDEIDAFFNEIYHSCNNFISLKRINCCTRIATLLIILLLVLIIVIIIQLALKNPFIGLMIIFFSLFTFVLFQFIIIAFVLRCCISDLSSKINVIISNHHQEYQNKGLRWKKNTKSIALLELWMDYKIMGKVISSSVMLENVSVTQIDHSEIGPINQNKYIELTLGEIPFTTKRLDFSKNNEGDL